MYLINKIVTMTLIDTQNICHLVEKNLRVCVEKIHDSFTNEIQNLFTGNGYSKTIPLTKVIIIIAAFINLCKIIKLIKATNIVQFRT